MLLQYCVCLLWLLTVLGIDALECYRCTGSASLNDCNSIAVCNDSESCFHDMKDSVHSLGCVSNLQCGTFGTTDSGHLIVGRSIGKRDTSQCHECCSTTRCNKELCEHLKLDGGWTQWSGWSSCDVTCSQGVVSRTRSCTNPRPSGGGLDCSGDATESKLCQTMLCPVNGAWSIWSAWGSCSASCDIGMQRRDRTCTNPPPSGNGSSCIGDSFNFKICLKGACADGGWSYWTSWGTCSLTCGTGTRTRSRNCTNPVPSITGRYCGGGPTETVTCETQTCSSQQVAFTASRATAWNPVIFTSVLYNHGYGYNSRTGRFTCPIAGIYYISSSLATTWGKISSYMICRIYINSVAKLASSENPTDDNKDEYSVTISGTFHLNVNDIVSIGCNEVTLNSGSSSFTGFLVTSDN